MFTCASMLPDSAAFRYHAIARGRLIGAYRPVSWNSPSATCDVTKPAAAAVSRWRSAAEIRPLARSITARLWCAAGTPDRASCSNAVRAGRSAPRSWSASARSSCCCCSGVAAAAGWVTARARASDKASVSATTRAGVGEEAVFMGGAPVRVHPP